MLEGTLMRAENRIIIEAAGRSRDSTATRAPRPGERWPRRCCCSSGGGITTRNGCSENSYAAIDKRTQWRVFTDMTGRRPVAESRCAHCHTIKHTIASRGARALPGPRRGSARAATPPGPLRSVPARGRLRHPLAGRIYGFLRVFGAQGDAKDLTD
jgi:hypothetical protein